MPSKHIFFIDFNLIASHEELLQAISPLIYLNPGDEVELSIDLNGSGLIFPDLLLILAARVDAIRKEGVDIQSILINPMPNYSRLNYASSRINFLNFIGINQEENLSNREVNLGGFIEISEFNQDNIYKIFDQTMRILLVNGVNEDMMVVLHFCLNEILDNTLNHSSAEFRYGAGTGYIIAQFFPAEKEIRIMIADTGQGIHAALTGHPNSNFRHLTEPEAVRRCIEKGVTNSLGVGFGLWATSQMMIKNKGDFKIFSGCSSINNGKLNNSPPWRGTLNFLRINTDISVNHKEIFGEKSDQLDMFQEFKESQFGDLENLW